MVTVLGSESFRHLKPNVEFAPIALPETMMLFLISFIWSRLVFSRFNSLLQRIKSISSKKYRLIQSTAAFFWGGVEMYIKKKAEYVFRI